MRKNRKVSKTAMYIIAKSNKKIIESPLIDFVVKKITKKNAVNIRSNTFCPKKYWKSFEFINYKSLKLRVPNNPENYLNEVYGKSWNKKAEFWSVQFKQ